MRRIFNRKKLFSGVLNLIGMTIAITAFMILIKHVWYDKTYDRNFDGSDRIYRLILVRDGDNSSQFSRPIINSLKDYIPQIEALGTYRYYNSETEMFLNEGDESGVMVKEALADKDLLDVFSVKMVEGDITDFDGHSTNTIISKSTAERLFPGESAIGKKFSSAHGWTYHVTGVYEDFPENCSVPNGVISSFGDENLDNGSEWSYMCYLKVQEGSDLETAFDMFRGKFVKDNVEKYQNITDEEREEYLKMVRFMTLRELYTDPAVSDYLPKCNELTVNSLLAISILILFIAIINFVNFSMASVPFDIRSINTRKVLGSTRTALILRRLGGALAVTFTAYLLSIIAIHFISGTSFASYISGSLKVGDNQGLLAAGAAVAVLVSFIAGIYPALYSTSFQPALVLKGSFSLSEKGRLLRNTLVGFQYVVTFILSIFALYIFVQTRFMKTYDMGFDRVQILSVPVSYKIGTSPESFRQKLLENPSVKAVTFAEREFVSPNNMGWGRSYNGERVQLDVLPVAVDFLDFFGMEIVSGRNFIPTDDLSEGGTFILNETAMAKFRFLEVGTKMTGHMSDDNPAEVVGVVKDFNFKPMQYAITPFALYNFGAYPWRPLTLAYIKVAPDGISATMEYIRNSMMELDPSIEPEDINIRFFDESIGNLYKKEERLNWIIVVAAIVSFVISLVGVLGLIYFETQFRRKEIALNKVYGATISDILRTLNRRYVLMAGVSFLVALPFVIAAIRMWVAGFPYKAHVPVWIFALSLVLTLLVTVATVTLRAYSAAASNPVESIKNE